ncbi:MAG: hypothetical protein ACJAS3_002783 [Roseivirga sp.]|jgi:hypothetical protein
MKGNKIDDLFRERLASDKITPPAGLWDKVEGNLDGKRKGVYFWLGIAAGILILLTVGKLVIDNGQEQQISKEALQASKAIETPKIALEKNQAVIPISPSKEQNLLEKREDIMAPQVISAPIMKTQRNLVANISLPQKTTLLSPLEEKPIDQRDLVSAIAKIDINQSLTMNTRIVLRQPTILAFPSQNVSNAHMDLSAVEIQKKRKFGMLDGIISIAKGVNSAKETLSEIRTLKNDFVSKELKYGSKAETEPEEKSTNFKDEN